MRITVRTADVCKKLEAKRKTISERRQIILDQNKKATAHSHKFLLKAYQEVIETLVVERDALQAGKPIPDTKSIVRLEHTGTRRGSKNYHSMIKVYTVQKMEDLYPDKWSNRYEKDRLNEQLRKIDEILGVVKLSDSETMEIDSERGEYFDILKY